jgi:Amt family ammonium transporter
VVLVMVYSFVITFIIGKVLDKTIGFRVEKNQEVSGIDFAEHRETAYESLVGAKL